jgi:hypothetical protein
MNLDWINVDLWNNQKESCIIIQEHKMGEAKEKKHWPGQGVEL